VCYGSKAIKAKYSLPAPYVIARNSGHTGSRLGFKVRIEDDAFYPVSLEIIPI
jgi:hypothetical protein